MTSPQPTTLGPEDRIELCPKCYGVGVHQLPRFAMGQAGPVSVATHACEVCGGSGRVVAAFTPYVPYPTPKE
jgi:DnaJ-class molecular chaperone